MMLYLRARAVPGLVSGLVVVVAAAGWLAARQVDQYGAEARVMVVLLAPALVAALVAQSFGVHDDDLERSTALRWPQVRLAHAVAGTVIGAGVLALAGLTEPGTYGAYELARNTTAYAGIGGAAAVVLGARLSWALVLGYAVLAFGSQSAVGQPYAEWWLWPVQPAQEPGALGAAAILFAAGLGLYATKGARPSRDADL